MRLGQRNRLTIEFESPCFGPSSTPAIWRRLNIDPEHRLRSSDAPAEQTAAPRLQFSLTSRLFQLADVWHASDDDVAARCGTDARDYLVLQRHTFYTLLAVAALSLCILLPVHLQAAREQAEEDAATGDEAAPLAGGWFASTTVRALPPGAPPALWAHAVVAAGIAVAMHALLTAQRRQLALHASGLPLLSGGGAGAGAAAAAAAAQLASPSSSTSLLDAAAQQQAQGVDVAPVAITLLLKGVPDADPSELRAWLDAVLPDQARK